MHIALVVSFAFGVLYIRLKLLRGDNCYCGHRSAGGERHHVVRLVDARRRCCFDAASAWRDLYTNTYHGHRDHGDHSDHGARNDLRGTASQHDVRRLRLETLGAGLAS